MTTPEGRVKRQLKTWLTECKVYHFWPVQTGYGAATLDCLCCMNGKFIGIETKRPGVLEPTPRQRVVMDAIEKSGGWAFCVDSLDEFLAQLLERKKWSRAMNICPCCGQPAEQSVLVSLDANAISRNGTAVHLTPQLVEMLWMLNEARPGLVTHGQLEDALYGQRTIERRSENPRLTIRVHLSDARRRLEKLKIKVVPVYGEGYRMVLE